MTTGILEPLGSQRAQQVMDLAERAREEMFHFSGQQIDYDSEAIQLLDEWIERVPDPSQAQRVLWIAFLGEVFRRRHIGGWAMGEGGPQQLVVLCPTVDGSMHPVAVAEQVARRIANGIVESLAIFYIRESILLRQPTNL